MTTPLSDAHLVAVGLDPQRPEPLFEQLYGDLRRRISEGRLTAGARLPASRPFSTELGVSRATVIAAYDQLIAEGYAEARRGSGVRVCDIGALTPSPIRHSRNAAPSVAGSSLGVRPFQPGQPDMRLFPHREWGRTLARVARTQPDATVDIPNGGGFGDLRLRAAIADHLSAWRDLVVPPERILITAGAGDALEVTIRSLARAGDKVALEDPGYQPLRHFVESLGLTPQWLDVGADGAEIPRPSTSPPVLTILTPSHQFPLGGAMPTARRSAFLRFADSTNGWIVEDDFDSEYRYAGRPIPALAGLDTAGRVIYVGTFSKVLSQSLRLGYLVVPETLMDAYGATLGRFGARASILPQRPLAVFMEDGGFHRHIRRMRRIYGQRRRAFLDLARSALGESVTVEDHQAGMQVLLRLADGTDDRAIAAAAAKRGVSVSALSDYHARPTRDAGLLCGFCAFDDAEMAAAMEDLAAALQEIGG